MSSFRLPGSYKIGHSVRTSAAALPLKSAAQLHWAHHDFLESPVRKIYLMLMLLFLGGMAVADAGAPIYNFKLATIDGDPTTLGAYKGKVLLVVNVASACGFTPSGIPRMRPTCAPM